MASGGSRRSESSTDDHHWNHMDPEERLRKFQYLIDRYEINRDFAQRLRVLEGYEIVFIVDGKFVEKDLKQATLI